MDVPTVPNPAYWGSAAANPTDWPAPTIYPLLAFFPQDKYLGVPGAVDVGIFAQTVALALEAEGVGCCMQGALGMWPAPARLALALPEERGILFGMSFGYAAEGAPANACRTDRAPLDSYVRFLE